MTDDILTVLIRCPCGREFEAVVPERDEEESNVVDLEPREPDAVCPDCGMEFVLHVPVR